MFSEGSVRGLPTRRRTTRSRTRSNRSAIWRTRRPMSLRNPTPCGGDRRAQLRRLGDPLDQLLHLVGGEQPIPDAVDELGVEDLHRRALDRRARERALERVLGRVGLEHADDRPLDRRALERAHDGLFGRSLDRLIDPGRRGEAVAGPRPGAEQPCR